MQKVEIYGASDDLVELGPGHEYHAQQTFDHFAAEMIHYDSIHSTCQYLYKRCLQQFRLKRLEMILAKEAPPPPTP